MTTQSHEEMPNPLDELLKPPPERNLVDVNRWAYAKVNGTKDPWLHFQYWKIAEVTDILSQDSIRAKSLGHVPDRRPRDRIRQDLHARRGVTS